MDKTEEVRSFSKEDVFKIINPHIDFFTTDEMQQILKNGDKIFILINSHLIAVVQSASQNFPLKISDIVHTSNKEQAQILFSEINVSSALLTFRKGRLTKKISLYSGR